MIIAEKGNEESNFVEFRRKVRSAEVLSRQQWSGSWASFILRGDSAWSCRTAAC